MTDQWKFAALGALSGAAIAVALVFSAAALGLLPRNDRQVEAYLMAHPSIVVDMMNKVQEQEEADAAKAQKSALARVGPAAAATETAKRPQAPLMSGSGSNAPPRMAALSHSSQWSSSAA